MGGRGVKVKLFLLIRLCVCYIVQAYQTDGASYSTLSTLFLSEQDAGLAFVSLVGL